MRIIIFAFISTLVLSSCGTTLVKETPLPKENNIPGATPVTEEVSYTGQTSSQTGTVVSSQSPYKEAPNK